MRKRRIYLALVGLGIVIGVIVVLSRPEREPEYGGKKLSEWVESGWLRSSFETTDSLSENSANAIRHIGTNALPCLLKWIRYEPAKWKTGLYEAVNWVLGKIDFSRRYWDPKAVRAGGVVAVFATMGPKADIAIPELSRILSDFKKVEGAKRAARALGYLGRDAVPPLMNIITNPQAGKPLRLEAFRSIYLQDTNAVSAVGDLVKLLRDPDNSIATETAIILFHMGPEAQLVMPAYVDALSNDTRSDVRRLTAMGISRFGTNALPAVPALLKLLNDPNADVREAATLALFQIDPEALEKATSQ